MPVYMIRCGANGPVKLGIADDPRERLAALQVAHFEELRLIRVWEGGAAEEAKLHETFADLWLRGEWFSFSRRMIDDVGLKELYRHGSIVDPADKAAQQRALMDELSEATEIWQEVRRREGTAA